MSPERRILEVLGRSAGGIARHVARVVEGLGGRDGLRIDVAGPADLPVPMGAPVLEVVIPDGPVRGHPGAVKRLRSIIVGGRYDMVHAHGLRAGIDASLAVRGRRGGDGTAVPVLVSVHNLMRPDILGGPRALVYRRAEGLAVRLSDRTFAPSVEIAEHLRATVSGAADKIEVLHLGVGAAPLGLPPAGEVRRQLGLGGEEQLVVTTARLAPQKALDVMLEALARLPGNVVLAILGDGPLEDELRSHAARLGVADRARFLGWQDEVAGYVAAADVFCLSSKWEAVALAVQEAVVLGTPVVATDVGGMGELITDRVSGRLVPSGDPSALASALADVLAFPEEGARYAAAAQDRLERDFSTEAMLDRLRRAYLGGIDEA
ncbi:MAG: glycosyltransferase [Actinobacteria bacterium]|nr:glycosyltransferase [Actinomycetota bacterium]MDQ3531908.1 glycosyltransferase [Actinomycetota bacterium]